MTRIIAGAAGGRRLRTPPGVTTRPTTERVREALFSALESRLGTLAGLRFLDVFAGSGAVGLEARSRGAAHATFVERDAATAAVLRRNVSELGLTEVTVLVGAARTVMARAPGGGGHDIAFLDPPYAAQTGEVATLLTAMAGTAWLIPDAVVVVERPRRETPLTWPHGFEHLRARSYGETMLWYGRLSPPVAM